MGCRVDGKMDKEPNPLRTSEFGEIIPGKFLSRVEQLSKLSLLPPPWSYPVEVPKEAKYAIVKQLKVIHTWVFVL